MKRVITAAVLALLAAPAFAETISGTVTIAPDQENAIREYIVHEHPAAVVAPPGFVVSNGVVIPETVKLYTFPAERHWTYAYTVIGDETVLVDPATRKIVRVIR